LVMRWESEVHELTAANCQIGIALVCWSIRRAILGHWRHMSAPCHRAGV
jgi:hypothetical protein